MAVSVDALWIGWCKARDLKYDYVARCACVTLVTNTGVHSSPKARDV